MAKEHASVAKKISGSVIRCGPRRMLHHICEKCGSGEPFKTKGGKTITMALGVYQCTDKEMGKVLGTTCLQSIRRIRGVMKKATQGAVTVTHEFKQGYRFPTLVYHVDLERLKTLLPTGSEMLRPSRGKMLRDGAEGRSKMHAHTGVPSEHVGRSASSQADEGVTNGGGDASTTTQRSAARRSDSLEDAYRETLQLHMEGLKQHGWRGVVKPELVSEIASKLELVGIEIHQINLLFNWMAEPKQAWILDKTKGRFDWLRDRVCKPQDLDNSLIQRFLNDLEAEQPLESSAPTENLRDCEFCHESFPPENTGLTHKTMKIACIPCAQERGETFIGCQPKPYNEFPSKKFEMEIEEV